MKNNLENVVKKALSEKNKSQEASNTNSINDNYFQNKKEETIIGSCGKSCAECKIGNCLNG